MKHKRITVEVTQPWVTYTFGLTHDRWWPLHNSTRVLGYAKVVMRCASCNTSVVAKMRMPRFGKIEDRGYHPLRVAFLKQHDHDHVMLNLGEKR